MTKFKLVTFSTFKNALIHAQCLQVKIKENTLTPYELEARKYSTRYCVLSTDERSGFIVTHEHELIAVFSRVPGRGKDIVSLACRLGANKLDCFNGYLVKLYSQFGFFEYKREKNYNEGVPDVIYMQRMNIFNLRVYLDLMP